MLIQVTKTGDAYTVGTLWRTKNLGGTYMYPVYHEGVIYGYKGRILTASDAATGERLWPSREPGDGTQLIVDGHLVTMTKEGALSVAPTSTAGFSEYARLQVFDAIVWSAACYAKGKFYARSMSEIACIEVVATNADAEVASKKGHIPGTQFAEFISELEQHPDKLERINAYLNDHPTYPVIVQIRWPTSSTSGMRMKSPSRAITLDGASTSPCTALTGPTCFTIRLNWSPTRESPTVSRLICSIVCLIHGTRMRSDLCSSVTPPGSACPNGRYRSILLSPPAPGERPIISPFSRRRGTPIRSASTRLLDMTQTVNSGILLSTSTTPVHHGQGQRCPGQPDHPRNGRSNSRSHRAGIRRRWLPWLCGHRA